MTLIEIQRDPDDRGASTIRIVHHRGTKAMQQMYVTHREALILFAELEQLLFEKERDG